jgi:branched-chain amino acid transport system permease protein
MKTAARRIFIVLIAVAFLLLPLFSSLYIQTLFDKLLINILIVVGLNFITGLTGQMNLGTVGIWALGAYFYGDFTTKLNWNPWLALIILVALGVVIGNSLGYPSLRLQGFYLSLTTIGFSEIVRLFITNLQDITGGVIGLNYIPKLKIAGYQFANYFDYFYILYFFTILGVWIAYRLVYSKWGRAFKAIRDSYEACEALGIKIATLKIQAFTLASLYACIAGGLYAGMNAYLNPVTFVIPESQNYVAMLMIGGIGSVTGNILGAALVTLLPELLRSIGEYYWLFFCTVCLVMAVLVPDGLYPLLVRFFRFIVKKLAGKGAATAQN